MTRATQTFPAETGGTEITRFNALRHGVLSRYTVLPWENADEYQAVVEALDPDKLERLGRYEVHLDRKLERMLTMLLA